MFIDKARKKLSNLFKNNKSLVSIIAVAIIGSSLLVFSFAATPFASVELEDGQLSANCVSKASDTTASQGSAIVFGSCVNEYGGLDPSGKTIPATNYSKPAGAIYMSPNGNDSSSGSENAPVKTINKAVSLVSTGGTIIMRGGEYRDWHKNSTESSYSIITKHFTLQAYPGESPWFNGADVVNDGWVSDGAGHWYRKWETPSFCDAKYYTYGQPPYTPQRNADGSTNSSVSNTACMYADAANDPSYPVAGNPQMVFVNNNRLQEVDAKSKISANSFYYDWYNKNIYIGTNPNGNTIELSARPLALVMGGASDASYAIKGIGFKKYATANTSGIASGAIYAARKTIIENSVFTQMASAGLTFSSPLNNTSIKNTVIAFNGGNGMNANGDTKTNTRNDFVIESNVFNSNNVENYGLYCSASCTAANVKLAHMYGYSAKNNIFENGYSRAVGFWCDLDCREGKIISNIARNNGGYGLFDEVSSGTIITSNIVSGNKRAGIVIASANVKLYNNTIIMDYHDAVEGIWVYDDNRYPGMPISGGGTWTDVGPNTNNVQIVNNIVSGPSPAKNRLIKINDGSGDPTYNTTAPQYLSAFEYNGYYRMSSQNTYTWRNDSTNYGSVTQFNSATGLDKNTVEKIGDSSFSNNFFIDFSGKDYRVAEGSIVYNNGKALPSDVASQLGLASGSVISRGAYNWPGRK